MSLQHSKLALACRYIDYVLSWGPAIAGHAVDEVNDALKAQIDKGTSFGAPCELEVRFLFQILPSYKPSTKSILKAIMLTSNQYAPGRLVF